MNPVWIQVAVAVALGGGVLGALFGIWSQRRRLGVLERRFDDSGHDHTRLRGDLEKLRVEDPARGRRLDELVTKIEELEETSASTTDRLSALLQWARERQETSTEPDYSDDGGSPAGNDSREPRGSAEITEEVAVAAFRDFEAMRSTSSYPGRLIRLNWAGHVELSPTHRPGAFSEVRQVGDFIAFGDDSLAYLFPNPEVGGTAAALDFVYPHHRKEAGGVFSSPPKRVKLHVSDTWIMIDERS